MSDILSGLLGGEAKTPDGCVLLFTIDKTKLEKALSLIESVVPSKDLIPVLKNFHFKITALDLVITGSDSVLSAVTHVGASTTSQEGSAVFPAARLLAVVREAPDGEISINVNVKKSKFHAFIKCGNTKWTIPLVSPAGFPSFDNAEDESLMSVDQETFLTALRQVRKAVSTDDMRPYLMMVDVRNGKMRASDSIRFQQVKFNFPFDCQIPTRAVHEVVQRLSANPESVEVGQTKSALLFRFDKVLLIAQKVMAKFPDVDEVLLKPALSNDQELSVNREDLLKAVRRVRITADDTTSAVVLSLNEGSVSVESKDRKGGTAVASVDATWNHSPRHVSFNHLHLSDLLSSTKSEDCVFRLGKDLKTRPTPLLMEDEEQGFTAVLSQIRLDWL